MRMPLHLIRDDITKLSCDAIVNPTNTELIPDGGLDAAIHAAAGEALFTACRALAPLTVGEAKLTDAFSLPCRYIIHTAGPMWEGGGKGEEAKLRNCYRNALLLAAKKGCESVAMPLIASGTLGFPKKEVLKIATDAITSFLQDSDMTVYLLVYNKEEYELSRALYEDVVSYIDDTYVDEEESMSYGRRMANVRPQVMLDVSAKALQRRPQRRKLFAREDLNVCVAEENADEESLEEWLKKMDKGFAETLFMYIDSRGITDVECYKRANVDKKTFSKIKCNPDYRPSKVTAVSFAIGLHLTVEEANHLLSTAGLTLSHSYRFDVIIEYFLKTGNYKTVHDVNEVLYQFDEVTLGVAC